MKVTTHSGVSFLENRSFLCEIPWKIRNMCEEIVVNT